MDKKELKKLKNRQAAERSYLRKKAASIALEAELIKLKERVVELESSLSARDSEVSRLREELAEERGVAKGVMLGVNRDTLLPQHTVVRENGRGGDLNLSGLGGSGRGGGESRAKRDIIAVLRPQPSRADKGFPPRRSVQVLGARAKQS